MAPPNPAAMRSHIVARLAARPLCQLVIAPAWVAAPVMLVSYVSRSCVESAGGKALAALLCVAFAFGAYASYVRIVETRPAGEMAPQGAGAEWLIGTLLGAGVLALAIGILATLGAYRITGYNEADLLLFAIPGAMLTAVFEEIVFRAILFRKLEEALGSWIALVFSASIFGLMHLGWPNMHFLDALAVAVEAGLLLGAAYMATGRLWLCIGIHFGWNWAQGAVFSSPVSGHAQNGLFQSELSGEPWLTGGQFGVESSVVAVFACLMLAAALVQYAQRRGKIKSPPWRGARSAPLPANGSASGG